MERLTKRELIELKKGQKIVCCNSKEEDCNGYCMYGYCEWSEKAFKKLKELEDLEEQGLLLRLPCKVGDTVFLIVGDIGEDGKPKNIMVDTDVIQRISIRKNTKVFTGRYSATYEENLGKTVFLTKAEAEKALAGMGK